MVPAHPCGENPLRSVISLSTQTGQDLPFVLGKLKQMDIQVYRHLQRSFQRYAECVGMVDTGYFKRSERNALAKINPFAGINGGDDVNVNDYSDVGNNRDVQDVYRTNSNNREHSLQETEQILSKDILPMLLSKRRRR